MLSLSVERLCDYFCIILIFWYVSPVGSCPWVISDAQNAIWWCHSSIASLMMLCPKPSHTSMRCCFRSNRSWTFVLWTHCCISLISYSQPGSDPDCWVATGSGAVNTDISCSRSLIVMRVLCAEALFCCKTKTSPAWHAVAAEWEVYVPLIFTPESMNISCVHPNYDTPSKKLQNLNV